MTRLRLAGGLVAVVAATPLLAGCADDVAPTAQPTPATTTSTSSAEPQPTPAQSTSGELTQESLPDPAKLGPKWEYRVQQGGAEEGFVGNGTPAVARDPREVVAVLTPLGCRPVRLPVPKSALEVAYGHADGTPAVGLLLEFDDPGRAGDFYDLRAAAMRDCVTWPRAQADVTVVRDEGTTFISVRDEKVGDTPVWTEGVKRAADQVLFVAVAGAGGRAAVASALS